MAVEFIYVRRDHYLVAVPVSGYIVQAKWTSHYTANWTIAVQIPGLNSIHRELKRLYIDGKMYETSGTMEPPLSEDTEVLCFALYWLA